MASNAVRGQIGVLEISTDGGTTYTPFAEIKDWEIKYMQDLIDASSHDSGGWKAKVPSIADWSATIAALYIYANGPQAGAFDAVTTGAIWRGRFSPRGRGTGKEQYVGDCFIKDGAIKSPALGLTLHDVQLEGAGPLVKSVQ